MGDGLRCSLLNWLPQSDMGTAEPESNVAKCLRNVAVRGNSRIRGLASQAPACL